MLELKKEGYDMKCRLLIMGFGLLLTLSFSSYAEEDDVYSANQTSASMIIKYAEKRLENVSGEERADAEKRYFLLYDIYIKANSYAILNKVFFWLSIVAALAVLLWPSLSVVFKSKLDRWEWLKSATVQTTVTALAALMFAFYSQYKDKQSYAEALMRHLIFSEKPPYELSIIVSDELSKIDGGFSFNSILGESADRKKIGSDDVTSD